MSTIDLVYLIGIIILYIYIYRYSEIEIELERELERYRAIERERVRERDIASATEQIFMPLTYHIYPKLWRES